MRYDTKNANEIELLRKRVDWLIEKGKLVELKEARKSRSLDQNAYFHLCVGIWADDVGYTIEEAKTVIKRELGYYYEKNGQKFLESTANMDTKRMAELTDKFRLWSSAEFGIYLPEPEEYYKAIE
jgi:hypothetical protein